MRTVPIFAGFLVHIFSLRNISMKSTERFAVQVALMTLAGFSAPASAFQPLITDDTGTQGSGGNQVELSFSEDRATAAGNIARLRTLPVVYTRGLTETFDVFAGFSYARIRSSTAGGDASDYGNPSFGAKWRCYENEKSKTSFALKPEVLFPVSAGREGAGLGKGKTSGNLTLILTQEVPFGAIHINAGVGRDRYRDTSNNPDTTTTRASIAPVWDLNDHWKLALDLGTEAAHAGDTKVRANITEFGAIYSPGRDLDFAFGMLRSTDNAGPRTTKHTASAGVTWRFR
jgi:hypothetical protein